MAGVLGDGDARGVVGLAGAGDGDARGVVGLAGAGDGDLWV